jgi:hypothetical protein
MIYQKMLSTIASSTKTMSSMTQVMKSRKVMKKTTKAATLLMKAWKGNSS